MYKKIPDDVLKFIQDTISMVPTVVLGSGASAAYGIAGMGQLAQYLIENIRPKGYEEENLWSEFTALLSKGVDLERALHKINLTDRLEKEVVIQTKNLILPKDLEVREGIVLNKFKMPLSLLISHLQQTANPEIKIITTNYDRLVEYAVDDSGSNHHLGFSGQYIKRFGSSYIKENSSKKVEILKVHGSLDWYINSMGEVLSLPDSFANSTELHPVMVTPGKNKYHDTHKDPFRTLITRVDGVFMKAKSLLIVGFGFNDDHIQAKLMQIMRTTQTPIIIVSKSLTENTIQFIKANKHSKVLGIEQHCEGSNLVFPNKDSLLIEDSIWDFGELLKKCF